MNKKYFFLRYQYKNEDSLQTICHYIEAESYEALLTTLFNYGIAGNANAFIEWDDFYKCDEPGDNEWDGYNNLLIRLNGTVPLGVQTYRPEFNFVISEITKKEYESFSYDLLAFLRLWGTMTAKGEKNYSPQDIHNQKSRLHDLSAYFYGGDGHKAEQRESIEDAVSFIDLLKSGPPFSTTLSADGFAVIEFEDRSNGLYVDLTFLSKREIECYAKHSSSRLGKYSTATTLGEARSFLIEHANVGFIEDCSCI